MQSIFNLAEARESLSKRFPNAYRRSSYNKHLILNPFDSLSELVLLYEITLPKTKSFWRLTEARLGHCPTLPSCAGLLVATDGMMAMLLRSDAELLEIHCSSFVEDQPEAAPAKARTSRPDPALDRYLQLV